MPLNTIESTKRPIVVYTFHTPDQSGGHMWAYLDYREGDTFSAVEVKENVKRIAKEYARDVNHDAYEFMRVSTIAVPLDANREQITDFLDFDVIEQMENGEIGREVTIDHLFEAGYLTLRDLRES